MLLSSQEDNQPLIIELPASKSILNRLLILNSINKKDLTIYPASLCNDVKEMLQALTYLGLEYQVETSGNFPEKLTTHWKQVTSDQNTMIRVEEAGTVFRFLMCRLAAEEGREYTLIPGTALKKRPIIELIEILNSIGADIKAFPDYFKIKGKKLLGGNFNMPANISSQFISALMLSSSLMQKPVQITLEYQILSKSYINMTRHILAQHQIKTMFEGNTINVQHKMPDLKSSVYFCEPDYSSAVYYWIMSILTPVSIYVYIPDTNSSQADLQIIPTLERMGAKKDIHVQSQKQYIGFKKQNMTGLEISMGDMPDQVPNIALLAVFCTNKTIIRDISHLKYKESNRIDVLISEFSKLGIRIQYINHSLVIEPCDHLNTQVTLDSHHDHRMAMIFLILQKIYPEIQIVDTECIVKSAPEFFELFKSFK